MSQVALSTRFESGVSLSQLGFRISTALARPKVEIEKVVQILRESRRFGWISLQVLTQVEPQRWEFAWPPEHENEVLLRADSTTGWVSVAIDGAISAEQAEEAKLLLQLVAQQVAQFVHRRELILRNRSLSDEARVINEQVTLGKFMDRAKSLIISRRGLSSVEAEEWLVGASIRFEKPLLNVAQEIVTAFSTPGFAT
jgi:hypothetical protein